MEPTQRVKAHRRVKVAKPFFHNHGAVFKCLPGIQEDLRYVWLVTSASFAEAGEGAEKHYEGIEEATRWDRDKHVAHLWGHAQDETAIHLPDVPFELVPPTLTFKHGKN